MELTTCKECKKMFNYISGDRLCPNCKKALEDKFTEVKRYVWDNPNVEMVTLSKEMNVSVRQIKQWIREERLTFSKDSPIKLPCQKCGTDISSGKYCKSCLSEINSGLNSMMESFRPQQTEKKPKTSGGPDKMRFVKK